MSSSACATSVLLQQLLPQNIQTLHNADILEHLLIHQVMPFLNSKT